MNADTTLNIFLGLAFIVVLLIILHKDTGNLIMGIGCLMLGPAFLINGLHHWIPGYFFGAGIGVFITLLIIADICFVIKGDRDRGREYYRKNPDGESPFYGTRVYKHDYSKMPIDPELREAHERLVRRTRRQ